MRKLIIFSVKITVTIVALWITQGSAQASSRSDATLFAVDDQGRLWTVELSSGSSTLVGSTGFGTVIDLAFSPSGELFGTTGNELITIDPSTGVGTFIGSHGSIPGIIVGLDFTPDGILYGVTQGEGALVRISPVNGIATILFPLEYSAIGDVTVMPDGTLLGTFFPERLIRIDPLSGTTTVIGNLVPMSTLDFDSNSGLLFGLENDPSNKLSIVDQSNGATNVIGSIAFHNFGGSILSQTTQQEKPVIGSFNQTRASNLSLKSGSYFAQARSSLSTYFPDVTITAFSELTPTVINNVDILFLSTAKSNVNVGVPLSQNEQATLLNFVTGGGCAILLPDNDTYDADADAANESLVDPFGMDISGTLSGGITATVIDSTRSLVTSGPYGAIRVFTQNYPGGITNIGAQGIPIAINSLGNALVIIPRGTIQTGSGVVIIFSDINTFMDDSSQGFFPTNESLFLNTIFYCMVTQQVYLPNIMR